MPGICFILLHHNKVPRAAFFLFFPFPAVFMCVSSRSVLQTTEGFKAEHKDLKVERPLLLKEDRKVAELRYNRRRRRPGTGTSSSDASRDASAWSLLSIPAALSTLSTMASSSAIAPNLPMAVTCWGRCPGPHFVLESCLPTHSVPRRMGPVLVWLTSSAA